MGGVGDGGGMLLRRAPLPLGWSDGDLARPPADLARPRAPTSSIQHASRTVEEDVGCCVPRRQGKLQARTDGFGAGGD
jgi:hypothetical protein